MSTTSPRAPGARAKFEVAAAILADLDREVAALALEASEGKDGAAKALADHRGRIDHAQRDVTELRGAVMLAARLDREAAAAATAGMRAEQLSVFRKAMKTRDKEMATVLEAAAAMAAAYGRYSEATLDAQTAVPSGTVVPGLMVGPEGLYGPAFGPCKFLILAELYRLGPDRRDGIGRIVLPFARPATESTRLDHAAIPPGLDEFKAANRVIVTEIERQVATLDAQAMAAALKEVAA